MDYVPGGVAALISGDVTPNRPRALKRALTPVKHQPSPNVTPKSEFLDDRSIYLSPSVQKIKSAKKSPKRIFQNPDLDATNDGEDIPSPKADKVKKHLQEDLESKPVSAIEPKKKKKNKRLSISDEQSKEITESDSNDSKKLEKSIMKSLNNLEENAVVSSPKKKNKKDKKSNDSDKNEPINEENADLVKNNVNNVKDKKKNKNKNNKSNDREKSQEDSSGNLEDTTEDAKKKKLKNYVNPNAITEKDTDSEHESDNEIQSDNEDEIKKDINNMDNQDDQSSDEEIDDKQVKKDNKNKKKQETEKPATESNVNLSDEIKRTLFVGNVPFSSKCKKEIKKIFSKYGQIETVRIRTISVKDIRTTPKLAVIKNELHPDRNTVNVYVKFSDSESVDKALVENNRVVNGCHLRVTRGDSDGDHDPKKALFVGNLPFAIEDEVLRSKFERCGEIVSIRVVRDKKTNVGKGFGYVNFSSKDAVELALQLPDEELTIKNRILRVKRCTQYQKKTEGNFKKQGQAVNNKEKWQANRGRQEQANENRPQGAFRRIEMKRKQQDPSSEGPPNKRPNINQPNKEKKTRKEFVGMTAEKKKKKKFVKGQKKRKALSEILSK